MLKGTDNMVDPAIVTFKIEEIQATVSVDETQHPLILAERYTVYNIWL